MPSPDIQIKITYAEPKEGEARREDKYRLAEDAYVAIERRYYDSSGDLQQTVTYHPPAIQVLTSEMRLGQLWGAGYPYTSVDNVSGITDEKFGATRRELVGVQNIDVPAGEFNDCLTISRVGASETWYWFCPGVGQVKGIARGNGYLCVDEVERITFLQ